MRTLILALLLAGCTPPEDLPIGAQSQSITGTLSGASIGTAWTLVGLEFTGTYRRIDLTTTINTPAVADRYLRYSIQRLVAGVWTNEYMDYHDPLAGTSVVKTWGYNTDCALTSNPNCPNTPPPVVSETRRMAAQGACAVGPGSCIASGDSVSMNATLTP